MNYIFLGAIDRHNASAVRKQGEIGMGNIIFLLFGDMNLEGNERRRVEQILELIRCHGTKLTNTEARSN